MTDLAGSQLLRLRREAKPRIDFPISKELHGRDRRTRDPLNIPRWIETDVSGKRGYEHVRGCTEIGHADRLAFEVCDRANAFIPEQFEAPNVHATDDRNLVTGIDGDEQRCRKM